jgi:hypothetical protein
MRKLLLMLALASSLFVGTSATSIRTSVIARHETKDVTVYVTKTGTKYHKSGCRYLKSSKIETTLAKAKEAGMTACSVCKP